MIPIVLFIFVLPELLAPIIDLLISQSPVSELYEIVATKWATNIQMSLKKRVNKEAMMEVYVTPLPTELIPEVGFCLFLF